MHKILDTIPYDTSADLEGITNQKDPPEKKIIKAFLAQIITDLKGSGLTHAKTSQHRARQKENEKQLALNWVKGIYSLTWVAEKLELDPAMLRSALLKIAEEGRKDDKVSAMPITD